MKGGVFRRDTTSATTTDLIINIINDITTTRVDIISLESLSGFLVKINFNSKTYPYFLKMNDTYTNINAVVDEIILKFAIITTSKFEVLPLMMEFKKISETASNFLKEANVQHEIYKREITSPICLSMIDLAFFNDINGRVILDKLNKLQCSYSSMNDFKIMIQYLKENVSGKKLGMITMESGTEYDTFSKIIDRDIPIPRPNRNTMLSSIICQIIRMTCELKIIHLDCHHKNVFILKEITSTIEMNKKSICRIIDFGRVQPFDTEATITEFCNKKRRGNDKTLGDIYKILTMNRELMDDLNYLRSINLVSILNAKTTRGNEMAVRLANLSKLDLILKIIIYVDFAYYFFYNSSLKPQIYRLANMIYRDQGDIWCNSTGAPLTRTLFNEDSLNEMESTRLISDALNIYTATTASPIMAKNMVSPAALSAKTFAYVPPREPIPSYANFSQREIQEASLITPPIVHKGMERGDGSPRLSKNPSATSRDGTPTQIVEDEIATQIVEEESKKNNETCVGTLCRRIFGLGKKTRKKPRKKRKRRKTKKNKKYYAI